MCVTCVRVHVCGCALYMYNVVCVCVYGVRTYMYMYAHITTHTHHTHTQIHHTHSRTCTHTITRTHAHTHTHTHTHTQSLLQGFSDKQAVDTYVSHNHDHRRRTMMLGDKLKVDVGTLKTKVVVKESESATVSSPGDEFAYSSF